MTNVEDDLKNIQILLDAAITAADEASSCDGTLADLVAMKRFVKRIRDTAANLIELDMADIPENMPSRAACQQWAKDHGRDY